MRSRRCKSPCLRRVDRRKKRELLERASKLLDGVRAARERAATVPVVRKEIGRPIFAFLLK